MNFARDLLIGSFLSLAVATGGCTPVVYDDRARNTVHQESWEEHYERGERFAFRMQWEDAVHSFERALSATRDLPPTDVRVIKTHAALGIALSKSKRCREALAEIQLALRLTQEDPAVYEGLMERLNTCLADCYLELDRVAEAEAIFSDQLRLRSERLGRRDPRTADAMVGFAVAYRKMARFDEAEALFLESFDIYNHSQGAQGVRIVVVSNELGKLYREMGQLDKSESRFKDAVIFAKRIPGNSELAAAVLSCDLADLYVEQKRYAEAEDLYRSALATIKKSKGSRSANVRSTLLKLANLLHRTGRDGEASDLEEEAATIPTAN